MGLCDLQELLLLLEYYQISVNIACKDHLMDLYLNYAQGRGHVTSSVFKHAIRP